MNVLETKLEDGVFYVYNITPETEHLLKIPKGIQILHIIGYYLDHLTVPEGILDVYLNYIGLKTIDITEGTELVSCSRNFLRK